LLAYLSSSCIESLVCAPQGAIVRIVQLHRLRTRKERKKERKERKKQRRRRKKQMKREAKGNVVVVVVVYINNM
jgi:hypothetical protein